jgi:hypothetical protein
VRDNAVYENYSHPILLQNQVSSEANCFRLPVNRQDPARLAVRRAAAPSLHFRGFASVLAFPARNLL